MIDFLEYWYCMCCVGFCIDIYITPGEIELTVIYVEIITYHWKMIEIAIIVV